MTEKQLARRDARRDLGAELLQSVREMKAGLKRVPDCRNGVNSQ